MADTKPAVSAVTAVDFKLTCQPAARKQWDKSEWEAKAKAKDEEYAQKAKAAEAALAKGELFVRRSVALLGMTDTSGDGKDPCMLQS
jgi:predicted transcriptional regulator